MSDKKNPKELLIEQVEDIVSEFEKNTGCRVLEIKRHFVDNSVSNRINYLRIKTTLTLK